ncbi:MAG: hypothetical protein COV45_08975 [Deltaproteobacteria bacterium CG11_big_fil_rev_8_21_14_0_20_47_16]|nr:MAG: hypothetical protein COV45_08975 [Deltaproteobacteria bacterium CG11_big_fil_rev_8_21_14_0_20_47_16]
MTEPQEQSQISVSVQNFGHSTQLIGLGGHYVLTDPHFGSRCLLWKRQSEMPDPGQLPTLDAVVISHAHPDHLNIDSFKFIPGSVPVFVPEGMAMALRATIQNPIIALNWWTHFALPSGLTITAVPARHNGGKILPWRFRKVCGWVIRYNNKSVYFAGDTRAGTHFKEIGNTMKINVALLPVGTMVSVPWNHMAHLSPKQAAEAAQELNPEFVIPNHWGSFGWNRHPGEGDVETFKGAMLMHNMGDRCVVVPPNNNWTQTI